MYSCFVAGFWIEYLSIDRFCGPMATEFLKHCNEMDYALEERHSNDRLREI
jgi:hypothetical protein